MTLAYLTNLYARASDSFIRAEVLQLRAFGHEVHTFSVRRPQASELVSEEIRGEHARTDYILDRGPAVLFASAFLEFLRSPSAALSALALALRCRWPGLKGQVWPLAYFVEGCYLARQLRKKKAGHLHDHIAEGCAVTALVAAKLAGIPCSMTVHGPAEFEHAGILAYAEKVRHCAFVAAISEYAKNELFRWIRPEDRNKVRIVRCGVRWQDIVPAPPVAARRLVCVGRLCEQKGHRVLMEALALLKNEAPFEVVLVGDGPLRKDIEARALALGVQDRIRITGWMDGEKVLTEVSRGRALVLSSFAEGLPVVIMEAFALERPVIATAIAGIPELVEPGVNGWLVPAGSAEKLAEAMRQALAADGAALERMGRDGRARVRERHDQTKEARKLEALFKDPSSG